MNTPCSQSNASRTSGTTVERRPPNRIASIGTPAGSSHSAAIDGHLRGRRREARVRVRGRASRSRASSRRRASRSRARAARSSCPPTRRRRRRCSAQLVKIEHFRIVAIAFGFVSRPCPGATPKNPASGLIACRRPSGPNFIQAMSSPTVSTFQPGRVGISIARFVLPHADGNAPAMYFVVALRRGQLQDQHVLGHPALVARHRRGDPQREALLAEQRVAAVAGAVGPDLAALGEVDDVLVRLVARPRHVLAAVRERVADRVQARDELAVLPEHVERRPCPCGS